MSLHQLLREVVRVEIKQLVRQIVQEEQVRIRSVRPPQPARLPYKPRELQTKVTEKPPIFVTYIPQSEPRSTFKGDSQAKKCASLRVWELVAKTLGPEKFMTGPHVFLASREGGDASTLQGLGVPGHAMMAVDSDPAAMSLFLKKYPTIPNRNADITYALEDMGRRPLSIFLDFSAQVTNLTFSKVESACKAVTPGGVLACTIAVGREKHWNGNGSKPCEVRLRMVESFVQSKLGYKPQVLARMRYTSESTTGPGSSLMAVVVLQLEASPPGPPRHAAQDAKLQEIGLQDLYRDIYRHRDNPQLQWLINCTEAKTEQLRTRVRSYPPPRVT
jgi:hypothetical protein